MRDHQARVRVTDDVWKGFRRAAGDTSIAEHLGMLVEREVERFRHRELKAGHADDAVVVDALERAAELQTQLAVIVDRLERRAAQSQVVRWEHDLSRD